MEDDEKQKHPLLWPMVLLVAICSANLSFNVTMAFAPAVIKHLLQ